MPLLFSVAALYPNALLAVQRQIGLLDEMLTERELAEYVLGDGAPTEWAPEGPARNPLRPKNWHMGRVKYFYECFIRGAAVEPVVGVRYDPRATGPFVENGAHRVMGAYFARKERIEYVP